METIIYNFITGDAIRITSEEVSFSNLQPHEDFMPLAMWEKVNGKVNL